MSSFQVWFHWATDTHSGQGFAFLLTFKNSFYFLHPIFSFSWSCWMEMLEFQFDGHCIWLLYMSFLQPYGKKVNWLHVFFTQYLSCFGACFSGSFSVAVIKIPWLKELKEESLFLAYGSGVLASIMVVKVWHTDRSILVHRQDAKSD